MTDACIHISRICSCILQKIDKQQYLDCVQPCMTYKRTSRSAGCILTSTVAQCSTEASPTWEGKKGGGRSQWIVDSRSQNRKYLSVVVEVYISILDQSVATTWDWHVLVSFPPLNIVIKKKTRGNIITAIRWVQWNSLCSSKTDVFHVMSYDPFRSTIRTWKHQLGALKNECGCGCAIREYGNSGNLKIWGFGCWGIQQNIKLSNILYMVQNTKWSSSIALNT